VPEAVANGISLTVYDLNQGNEYARQAGNDGVLRLHVKVDTGMGRLGVTPAEALEFLEKLHKVPLEIEGLFTHFARADEPGQPTTLQQIDRFEELLDQLRADGICPRFVHAANSAGAINFPQARYNIVRAGNALYGLHPSPQSPLPASFRSALTWKTRLTSVRIFPKNHGISYGHIYHTRADERIGSIAIGYADGYRRVEGNIALVNGKRVPVVGRVCMDQSMLLLDNTPEAMLGDEVILLGKQGDETITAEEVALRWGTINYEVVCGLASRLPRIYQNE
jgi:alanine racemase